MTQVSSNQPQEKVSARAAPKGAITARSRSEAHNTGVMKRPYQYGCQRSGTIKAFKQMTASRAEDLNRKLAATGGEGRWIPTLLEGGSGGVLSLVLATLFIGLLVPLVEELIFRGVINNALLRYGPLIGVVAAP